MSSSRIHCCYIILTTLYLFIYDSSLLERAVLQNLDYFFPLNELLDEVMHIRKAVACSRGLPQQSVNQKWSLVRLNFWEVNFLQTVTSWQAEPLPSSFLTDPIETSQTAARKLNGRLQPAPCLSSAIQDCVTRDFCLQMALTRPCSHRKPGLSPTRVIFTQLRKQSVAWSVQR